MQEAGDKLTDDIIRQKIAKEQKRFQEYHAKISKICRQEGN